MWEIYLTDAVNRWLDDLAVTDAESHRQAVHAIEALARAVPTSAGPWSTGSRARPFTT